MTTPPLIGARPGNSERRARDYMLTTPPPHWNARRRSLPAMSTLSSPSPGGHLHAQRREADGQWLLHHRGTRSRPGRRPKAQVGQRFVLGVGAKQLQYGLAASQRHLWRPPLHARRGGQKEARTILLGCVCAPFPTPPSCRVCRCEELSISVGHTTATFDAVDWIVRVTGAAVFDRIAGPRHRQSALRSKGAQGRCTMSLLPPSPGSTLALPVGKGQRRVACRMVLSGRASPRPSRGTARCVPASARGGGKAQPWPRADAWRPCWIG